MQTISSHKISPKGVEFLMWKRWGGLAMNVGWILVVITDDSGATLPCSSALGGKLHTVVY